jgi:hypothetical protein
MSKITYAVVITIGIMMFAIGALADHSGSASWNESNGYNDQSLPLPLIVKTADRAGESDHRPF